VNKFPLVATQRASDLIMNRLCTRPQIGFVVSNLNDNEFAYKLLHNINKYLSENLDTEISLFCSDKSIPVITPLCPIYSLSDINSYGGDIIVSDFPSWQMSLNNYASKKFFYVYDVSILNKIPKELVEKVNNSNYIMFSRTPKHNEVLRKIGFKVSDFVLEEIEIKKLESIYG